MKKEVKLEEKSKGGCEFCAYYEYDDEYEYYVCSQNLDEDEMYHFMTGRSFECPYFRYGDEYAVVKHQAF